MSDLAFNVHNDDPFKRNRGLATEGDVASVEPVEGYPDLLSGDGEDLLPFDLESEVVDSTTAPIQLSGEDLERFKFRFFDALENAHASMDTIHAEAKLNRKIFDLIEKLPAYPGGPTLTLPLSRNKAEGILGHMREAIEQRPFASFIPQNFGQPAEEAAQIAPIFDAYLEREINNSESREVFSADLPKEVVQVGTSIAKLSIAAHEDGEDYVQADLIKIENFYTDRINVTDFKDSFCAYKYKERYYNLEARADEGRFDREAVERLRDHPGDGEVLVKEGEEKDFYEAFFSQENTLHTVYEGYMRFKPKGEQRARLFLCTVIRESRVILELRENPFAEAFDSPPFAPVRISKKPKVVFGVGIPGILRAIQELADAAANTHIINSKRAASPPVLYNKNNPIAEALAKAQESGAPLNQGQWIPNYGPPNMEDIRAIELPFNNIALQDMGVFSQMADQATYNEPSIGGGGDRTRKTLGQFRTEFNIGTLKLRLDLADFAYDMARVLKMYWAMVNAFKVKRRGVVEVGKNGKLLAYREILGPELFAVLERILEPILASGRVNEDELIETLGEFEGKLTGHKIPSSRHPDLIVTLTGSKIIADKISEWQMLESFTPYLNLLEAAAMSSYINYHLRTMLVAMGFKDVSKRIPPDPNGENLTPEQRRMAMAEFNQLAQHSTRM